MTTRDKIVADARELLGVPWVHQGRTLHGLDCGGVVVYVAKKNGLSDFDVTAYGRRPTSDEFIRLFSAGGAIPIQLRHAKHGDIIVTAIKTFPSHCGILGRVLDRGGWRLTLIHAYAPYRKVVESPYDEFWKEKAWGAFRFPGVNEE